ncbi:hypothetical protein [Mycolicibacterium psychrotolerans]|uniref:hypothetical protein n=1 Tax=Mycolicibacterium psychrotolerans TaxID=216929 RepID=UPI001FE7A72C|nr:hypothetical protein [Mycolicibacterium psychrotolerans]
MSQPRHPGSGTGPSRRDGGIRRDKCTNCSAEGEIRDAKVLRSGEAHSTGHARQEIGIVVDELREFLHRCCSLVGVLLVFLDSERLRVAVGREGRQHASLDLRDLGTTVSRPYPIQFPDASLAIIDPSLSDYLPSLRSFVGPRLTRGAGLVSAGLLGRLLACGFLVAALAAVFFAGVFWPDFLRGTFLAAAFLGAVEPFGVVDRPRVVSASSMVESSSS